VAHGGNQTFYHVIGPFEFLEVILEVHMRRQGICCIELLSDDAVFFVPIVSLVLWGFEVVGSSHFRCLLLLFQFGEDEHWCSWYLCRSSWQGRWRLGNFFLSFVAPSTVLILLVFYYAVFSPFIIVILFFLFIYFINRVIVLFIPRWEKWG
jgi:hypothetical protein